MSRSWRGDTANDNNEKAWAVLVLMTTARTGLWSIVRVHEKTWNGRPSKSFWASSPRNRRAPDKGPMGYSACGLVRGATGRRREWRNRNRAQEEKMLTRLLGACAVTIAIVVTAAGQARAWGIDAHKII